MQDTLCLLQDHVKVLHSLPPGGAVSGGALSVIRADPTVTAGHQLPVGEIFACLGRKISSRDPHVPFGGATKGETSGTGRRSGDCRPSSQRFRLLLLLPIRAQKTLAGWATRLLNKAACQPMGSNGRPIYAALAAAPTPSRWSFSPPSGTAFLYSHLPSDI